MLVFAIFVNTGIDRKIRRIIFSSTLLNHFGTSQILCSRRKLFTIVNSLRTRKAICKSCRNVEFRLILSASPCMSVEKREKWIRFNCSRKPSGQQKKERNGSGSIVVENHLADRKKIEMDQVQLQQKTILPIEKNE